MKQLHFQCFKALHQLLKAFALLILAITLRYILVYALEQRYFQRVTLKQRDQSLELVILDALP